VRGTWQIHVVSVWNNPRDSTAEGLHCFVGCGHSKQMNQWNGLATAKEGFKAEVFAGGEGLDHTWSPTSGVQPKRLVPGSCVLSMVSPCLCKCVILLCP
jgi:hypothetical protein